MPTAAPRRALREDARRNHQDVLAAAERIFARDGLEASVEAIAAEAGVGVGTVYRRFESKAGLIDALFADGIAEAVAVIERCGEAPTGREALESVLRAFVEMQARSMGLRQMMFPNLERANDRLAQTVEPLLSAIIERAKSENAVRADFAATDIPVITYAISGLAARMPDGGADLARRHLEFVIKGIVATTDSAPVPPPLPDEKFADWLRSTSRERLS